MGEKEMAKLAFACVAVLLVFNALGDDVTEQHMSEMSRSELVAQLSATQKEAALTRSQLAAANDRISAMEIALQQQHEGAVLTEKQRVVAERNKKAGEKKKEAKRRALRLKKKQKLEDVLMEHAASFVAMKTAKKFSHKDTETQKTAVMKATLKAARAGAVGPLRKVARTVVAAAVKKARKEGIKAGKNDKHTLRKMSMIAAKAAFSKVMKRQNAQVTKTVDKVAKKAMAKYPAAMQLETDEPAKFTAPPSIHIGLLDDEQELLQDPSTIVLEF